MLSGAFSMQQMESGILGPIQGWLIEKVGPRVMVRIGVVVAGIGLLLLSQVNSVWQFYAAFMTIALGSSLGGFMAVFATITNWFTRKRSQAIGISMAGMSIGGLMVPILAWFMGNYGWRPTAFVSGIVLIVVGVPVAQLLRHTPEEYGYLPDGIAPESTRPDAAKPATPEGVGDPNISFTALEALKTRSFWFLAFGHAAALLVVSALLVHLIPHVVDRLGFSVTVAGTIVTLMTATMIVSQVWGGVLGDRIDKRLGLTVCLLGHSVALFGLAFSTTIWQVALFAVLHGISWGARAPMAIAIRADYFGRTYYATIMGFSSLVMMLGMMAGPLFVGGLADRLGDYRVAFATLASVAGLGSVLFLLARRPLPPSRREGEQRLRPR